jgi:hypothetical protein
MVVARALWCADLAIMRQEQSSPDMTTTSRYVVPDAPICPLKRKVDATTQHNFGDNINGLELSTA